MKNTIKYLAIAAALVFGLASCTKKAPEYQPAPAVGNAEVFFAPGQPSSIDLKGNPGTITVAVKRVQSASAITASISSSAPSIFSVPSSVSFDAGSAETTLNISFDPTALEEEVDYPIVLTLTSEVTPYGSSEYSFTASIPAAWQVFGKGTFYECPDWWNEVEVKTLYYQVLADGTYMMKIPECFGHDTIAGGNPYNVQDYIFYWDPETNYCRVPGQYMGYDSDTYGQYWHSDVASFYAMYRPDDPRDWDAYFRGNGTYMPYYDDVKGIFYLSDQYYYAPEPYSSHWGYGNWDLTPDSFWLDGFVRTVNYNDDDHIGASSALYEGYTESNLLSFSEEPVQIEMSMRYDASYLDKAKTDDDGNFDPAANAGLTTTYYIAEYFGENNCLAFTAPVPELLKEGSEIEDVENYQATGLQFMGNDLYVNVKKGTVSFEENDEFPTFNLVLTVYSMDEEGTVTASFGTTEELYQALEYGKDNYTLEDIDGANLNDYLGTWAMNSIDYNDGETYTYKTIIEYAGQDEEGTYMVKITNLSGSYGALGLVDELYAEWDTSYGLLWLYGQNLENPITYQGNEYPIGIYPWDPDTDKRYGQGNCLLGGLTEDGYVAFVNRYTGVNLAGLCYYIDGLGWLAKVYYMWGEKISNDTNSAVNSFGSNFAPMTETAPVAGYGVLANNYGKIGNGSRGTKAQSVKAVRQINLNNCKKSEKESFNASLR